jgi:hypothetical protein
MNTWRARRPFEWGIVLLMDRDALDVPPLTGDVVSHSAGGLAVKVLHAQDVDLSGLEVDDVVPPAQVEIVVLISGGPPADPVFSGVIEVPSGVLTVGEAGHQDACWRSDPAAGQCRLNALPDNMLKGSLFRFKRCSRTNSSRHERRSRLDPDVRDLGRQRSPTSTIKTRRRPTTWSSLPIRFLIRSSHLRGLGRHRRRPCRNDDVRGRSRP